MDKIREEFEKWISPSTHGAKLSLSVTNQSEDDIYENDIINGIFCGFKAGCKSRDEEIKKLNEIISTQETYINNTLRSDSDKVESKIKRLRDALEEIKRRKLYVIDNFTGADAYIMYKIATEALKESE